MFTVQQLMDELQQRTGYTVTLSRFVTMLHRWMRKRSQRYINQSERKRLNGEPYLTDDEAYEFLTWAQSLDKSCFYSLPLSPSIKRSARYLFNS